MNQAETGRGNISLLPDSLVDQIAAGEVVERPASVVKELVENSLDAAATRIRVEIRDGGKAWMSVTDDGQGMSPGDARLALQRHATSKLRTQADLARVASFGFRGEALPAIASVSRLRLLTRPHHAAEAFEIRVEGGERIEERAASGPVGTRIEVADLFAAVPARRKFLKRAGTEWGHIADWLSRLALALPGIHFDVSKDERTAFTWPSTTDPLDRIAAVLSEQEAAALLPTECEDAAGHLQAYLSPPDRTRASANGLYLFVNNRPVRDRVLRHALLGAYRDLLPRTRFPTAVLFLTVPLDSVDVNVHPAKWEVRFSDPQAIHQLIRRAVRSAMEQRAWLGTGTRSAANATSEGSDLEWPTGTQTGQGERVADRPFATWERLAPLGTGVTEPTSHAGPEEDRRPMKLGSLRLVGQILASYFVVEGPDGLLLVDQHAAHERVLYERLRAQWFEQGVDCQRLLIPATVELAPLSIAALSEEAKTVTRLGFEVEPFGEGTVAVRGVPALLADTDPAGLVRDLADELRRPGFRATDAPDETRLLDAVDSAFATLACHSARRAGERLEPQEQRAIIDALDSIPWAPCCPHGRPVAVAFDQVEIERRFGRR
jgi:DNA mismatch repair protein MutL